MDQMLPTSEPQSPQEGTASSSENITYEAGSTNAPPSLNTAINYLLALITFVIGILLGFVLFRTLLGGNGPSSSVARQEDASDSVALGVPVDAIQIQSCADGKGALFVRPQDIPVGPIYMVHEGKVVGLEFMLSREDFINGKSYKHLSALNMTVDHVNIGLLSQGHEGYTIPHYHVDLYNISKSVEEAIKCPTSAASPTLAPADMLIPETSTESTVPVSTISGTEAQ